MKDLFRGAWKYLFCRCCFKGLKREKDISLFPAKEESPMLFSKYRFLEEGISHEGQSRG
jgi:hypothetical protein